MGCSEQLFLPLKSFLMERQATASRLLGLICFYDHLQVLFLQARISRASTVSRPCAGAHQLLLSFSDPPARLRMAELIDKPGSAWPLCARLNDGCTFGGAPQRSERPPILRHPRPRLFPNTAAVGEPRSVAGKQLICGTLPCCALLPPSASLSNNPAHLMILV